MRIRTFASPGRATRAASTRSATLAQILKVTSLTLFCKCTRALTFQNLCLRDAQPREPRERAQKSCISPKSSAYRSLRSPRGF